MKKLPLTKIQKIHFKRPFIYACPQLKFGSLCITINEKNEILDLYQSPKERHFLGTVFFVLTLGPHILNGCD